MLHTHEATSALSGKSRGKGSSTREGVTVGSALASSAGLSLNYLESELVKKFFKTPSFLL